MKITVFGLDSVRRLATSFILCAVTGCSAQYVKEGAQEKIRAGEFEQAMRSYDEALEKDPENVVLRAGKLSAQETIASRLYAQLAAARQRGDFDGAERVLARIIANRPSDDRAQAIRTELEGDRSMALVVRKAHDLFARGMREQAMQEIDRGLKINPKEPELLALRRQSEQENRQVELTVTALTVGKPISLDFRDANLRMVLDVLTRNSGINFLIDKDVRSDLRTTVYMQDARFSDVLDLITGTSQLAYKAIDSKTVLVYPKTPEKLKEYQDLLVRAFYLTSAEARQTAVMLKTMLRIREPFIDEKLNMIMVRETPETVRMAERLIALHDMAEPEVMMELEVLEVQSSSLTQLGINYPDGFTLTPIPPNKATSFTLGNVKDITRDTISVGLPPVPINLHRDVGDANILANPKIRARNREKARILIGDKLPIVTTTGNASNGGFIAESVQYVDVGLKLDIEPTIYLDDEVALKIGLEVSSLQRSITTASGSLVYQLGTRNTNTTLRLRDGETQLLAGLINKQERMSANRVPGLGDLPLVGRLFASQRDDNGRTEIVLSVTPRVVRNIRRPELSQTEFWSGTENEVHTRPLVSVASHLAAPSASAPSSAALPTIPAVADAEASAATLALKLLAPKEVKAGEQFSVHVLVKSAVPVRGIPVQIGYSDQLIQLTDIEEGAFFSQDGSAVSKTKVIEQKGGKAAMTILRNQPEGIRGEGTAMTLRFKALATGSAGVQLLSASAIAAAPLAVASLPPETTVEVR